MWGAGCSDPPKAWASLSPQVLSLLGAPPIPWGQRTGSWRLSFPRAVPPALGRALGASPLLPAPHGGGRPQSHSKRVRRRRPGPCTCARHTALCLPSPVTLSSSCPRSPWAVLLPSAPEPPLPPERLALGQFQVATCIPLSPFAPASRPGRSWSLPAAQQPTGHCKPARSGGSKNQHVVLRGTFQTSICKRWCVCGVAGEAQLSLPGLCVQHRNGLFRMTQLIAVRTGDGRRWRSGPPTAAPGLPISTGWRQKLSAEDKRPRPGNAGRVGHANDLGSPPRRPRAPPPARATSHPSRTP